ncbi:putative 5'-nucleotidase [Streptococcus anginosus]|nr:putative 5'-nucleotidase [Streptococcus anginosus]
MKKKKFIIPILSTLLIAPAILAHQVSADAVDPATSTAPVEQVEAPKENQSVAPTTAQGASAASPATEASTEKVTEKSENKQVETSVTLADSITPVAQAVVAPTAQSEKDTVILHTNDVHGRIVEEKGVIGDAN